MAEIRVAFFAGIADLAGTISTVLDVAEPVTVGGIRRALITGRSREFEQALAVCVFLVNDELTRDDDYPVTDSVDVLPPFAGG